MSTHFETLWHVLLEQALSIFKSKSNDETDSSGDSYTMAVAWEIAIDTWSDGYFVELWKVVPDGAEPPIESMDVLRKLTPSLRSAIIRKGLLYNRFSEEEMKEIADQIRDEIGLQDVPYSQFYHIDGGWVDDHIVRTKNNSDPHFDERAFRRQLLQGD